LLILFTTAMGFYLSRLYKAKVSLFFDMVNFCNSYEANLDFYQKNLEDFVTEFCATASIEFVLLLKNYFNVNPQEHKELFFYKIFSINLSNEQKTQIDNLFSCLGKSDVVSQKRQLVTYQYYFKKELEDAKAIYETKGKIFTKLGIVLGFFLSVLIV